MAAITSAVVVAAGSAYAANRQGAAAKDAASAQRDATNQGIAEQRAARDQFQTNINPYLETGGQFNTILGRLAGGDRTAFTQSPGYQFQLDQGMKAIDRGASAQGNYRSGGTDADRYAFSQGLAANEYNNFFNQNLQGAQMGANAAVGAGSQGQQSANSISQLLGNLGNANAQMNSAGATTQAGYGNALGTGLSAWAAGRQSSYQPPAGGFGAFSPNQQSQPTNYLTGMLGPSNGSSWNFGPGTY